MSESAESMEQRRAHLAATIARQRGQLAEAYRNIEKPIRYTEYGMKGFGFLRQNPWVLTAVPAALSISSTIFGLVRNKPVKAAPRQRQSKDEERRPKGFIGHATKWGGRGVKLFQLYRKYRRYLPL